MTNYVCKNYPKFDDDCDALFKKCNSLKEDIENFKIALIDDILNNNGRIPHKIVHVNKLKAKLPVFKVKRFRCASIPKGNRSGFRIIFAYDQSLSLIYFIEVYYKKNDKTDMNRKRAIEACEFICKQ
ncbi:MAG: hypothetical protein LBM26_00555 [Methanobrevibacter sp.]|jgi:mRNA-degrading endonuclease RelE of RelBE toxin-antitoxin system|nr:hypothetical protein [Methanobrevibacter sp.]